MQDFEKLGVFYLGRESDAAGKAAGAPVLYDSRDLVTHGVCVGMTGSGKTGLCISLIEEAAIDGVPVIAIDPKGDLGNLLLTFPKLARRGFPAVDRRGRGEARGHDARRVRRGTGRAMEEGTGRLGRGWRPHRTVEGVGRVRHLHARQQRGPAALDPQLVRRTPAPPFATTGKRSRSARPSRRRACSPWQAPTPIRGDGSTRSSPRCSSAPGARGRTSICRR